MGSEQIPTLTFRRTDVQIALMVCTRLATIGFKPKLGLTQRTVLNIRALEKISDDLVPEYQAIALDQAKRDGDGKPITVRKINPEPGQADSIEYEWDDPMEAGKILRDFWNTPVDVRCIPYSVEDLGALNKTPDDIAAIMRGLGPLCPTDALIEEGLKGFLATTEGV